MKKLFVILLFLGFAQTVAFAQGESSSAFGLRYIVPTGTTGDIYESGWGLTGTSYFEAMPMLDIIFEGGWFTLTGKDVAIENSGYLSTIDDLSILSLTAGPVLKLGLVDLGIKGGYFFGDLHEWDLLPFAQVDIWKFSLGGEYKALGNAKWFAAYLNFNFIW